MVPSEARLWTHSNSINSTGVDGLHFLNVHLTKRSGVKTYELMEMIMVEPNVRVSDRDMKQPFGLTNQHHPCKYSIG